MRLIGVILISFLFGAIAAEAQQAEPFAGESVAASSDAIIGLLKQSHDQDQSVAISTRWHLLRMQAQAVLPLDADLGREWGEEASRASLAWDHEQGHKTSLEVLAQAEPERAIEQLHLIKAGEGSDGRPGFSPKMSIAMKAFAAIARRDGVSALPKLEEEAARFGAERPYPYAAMGVAAVQAVNGDWAEDNGHAIEVVKAIFESNFARYRQGSQGFPDDFEFGQMLAQVSGALPGEIVRPAVGLLVKNFLAMDVRKNEPFVEVTTKDGQSVRSENGSDAGILYFGGLIQRVDPELAQELKTSRPGLRNLEFARDGTQTSMRFAWKSLRPSDPAQEARDAAVRLSWVDSDAAIAKTEQLPKDERWAGTALEVARGIAGDDPRKAAQLITGAIGKNDDDVKKLNVVSALAFVAAAEGKKEEFHEDLRQGFELAALIFAEQQRTSFLHLVDGLPQLVQLGTQRELAVTTAFVQSMPACYPKALLFLGMASAMQGAGGLHERLKAAE
jgi:hypothetical protein